MDDISILILISLKISIFQWTVDILEQYFFDTCIHLHMFTAYATAIVKPQVATPGRTTSGNLSTKFVPRVGVFVQKFSKHSTSHTPDSIFSAPTENILSMNTIYELAM